jgi:hypothetical protein
MDFKVSPSFVKRVLDQYTRNFVIHALFNRNKGITVVATLLAAHKQNETKPLQINPRLT